MSGDVGVEDVARALEVAQGDETADFGSGVQGEEIVAIEHYLGVKFPASYREFLKRVGWCSFGGREFYGITPGGVTATSVPSVVFATRSERQHGLPESFLVIEDRGEGQCVLDTGRINAEGEVEVNVWTPALGPQGDLEVLAADFGSYLLRAATEATE